MAYVKQHSIKSTLGKSLKYIINAEKTEGNILIEGLNCSINYKVAEKQMNLTKKIFKKEGGILGYHFIQSFKPGEINDINLAQKIGIEFAQKISENKYQALVTTHIDKKHIHNHIIMNSVNLIDGKKYHSCKEQLRNIRQISNDINKKYNLSIIEEKKEQTKSTSYKEWMENKKGTSWKCKIKNDIDEVINNVNSFEEFINILKSKGYEIKYGNVKYIAFKCKGQQRFTRGKTLGEGYTEEVIKDRILNKKYELQYTYYRKKDKKEWIDFDIYKFKYKKGTLANNIALTGSIIKNILGLGEERYRRKYNKFKRENLIRSIKDFEKALLFIDKNNLNSEKEINNKLNYLMNKENNLINKITKQKNTKEDIDKIIEEINLIEERKNKLEKVTKSFLGKIIHKKDIRELEMMKQKFDDYDEDDINNILKTKAKLQMQIMKLNDELDKNNNNKYECIEILNIISDLNKIKNELSSLDDRLNIIQKNSNKELENYKTENNIKQKNENKFER